MKITRITTAIVALSLGLSSIGFAQTEPHVGRGDNDPARLNQREARQERVQERRQEQRADRRQDHRQAQRVEQRQDHRQAQRVEQRQEQRIEHRQEHRADRREQRVRQERREDRREYRQDRRRAEARHEHWDHRDSRWDGHWNRGAGPQHSFYRGGRLPPQYRSQYYVVDDWRGHQLRQPPQGYHWIQTGGDYVLAAVATGVILSIFLNN